MIVEKKKISRKCDNNQIYLPFTIVQRLQSFWFAFSNSSFRNNVISTEAYFEMYTIMCLDVLNTYILLFWRSHLLIFHWGRFKNNVFVREKRWLAGDASIFFQGKVVMNVRKNCAMKRALYRIDKAAKVLEEQKKTKPKRVNLNSPRSLFCVFWFVAAFMLTHVRWQWWRGSKRRFTPAHLVLFFLFYLDFILMHFVRSCLIPGLQHWHTKRV